jgi:hypothetical protein
MKPDFNEAYLADNLDPVDGKSVDFDWTALAAALGEMPAGSDDDADRAELVRRLLIVILGDSSQARLHPQAIGLRLIAMVWLLDPANFEGSPSVTELAKRCGVSPAALAQYTGRASRFIGWRNRGQQHASNWKPTKPA